MNINRDNYEQFFLLYVDNELSADERNAVDLFLAENADLRGEFQMLSETTLPAEEISFGFKNSLLKKENEIEPVLENMLLLLDNQLDSSAAASLKKNIAADASLKNEWEVLQQTKLNPAEKIVFEEKKLLYRHSAGRVVSMGFRRFAVAAAIIGAGLFIVLTITNKGNDHQDVASVNTNTEKVSGNKIAVTIKPDVILKEEKVTTTINKANDVPSEINSPVEKQNRANVSPKKVEKKSIRNEVEKQEKQVKEIEIAQKENKKETNNLPKPYYETVNNSPSNKLANNDVPKAVERKLVTEQEKITPKEMNDIEITSRNAGFAKTAALDESASEKSNNHILFLNEETVSKTKLSGLFKRVKRVISRSTNITTGNSVRIAGFEIAAR